MVIDACFANGSGAGAPDSQRAMARVGDVSAGSVQLAAVRPFTGLTDAPAAGAVTTAKAATSAPQRRLAVASGAWACDFSSLEYRPLDARLRH